MSAIFLFAMKNEIVLILDKNLFTLYYLSVKFIYLVVSKLVTY